MRGAWFVAKYVTYVFSILLFNVILLSFWHLLSITRTNSHKYCQTSAFLHHCKISAYPSSIYQCMHVNCWYQWVSYFLFLNASRHCLSITYIDLLDSINYKTDLSRFIVTCSFMEMYQSESPLHYKGEICSSLLFLWQWSVPSITLLLLHYESKDCYNRTKSLTNNNFNTSA